MGGKYQIFSISLEALVYEFFIVLKVRKVHFIAYLFNWFSFSGLHKFAYVWFKSTQLGNKIVHRCIVFEDNRELWIHIYCITFNWLNIFYAYSTYNTYFSAYNSQFEVIFFSSENHLGITMLQRIVWKQNSFSLSIKTEVWKFSSE